MPDGQDNKATLAIDIGGTGIKAILLDGWGKPTSEREHAPTPQPATPNKVFALLDTLASKFSNFDRVSVGFPGVVKGGVTLTAHNLHQKWIGLNFQLTLARRWKKPVHVLNDAAVQGFGAIRGKGLELVITLGTGFGSSLFINGTLVPGLELAHHPWRKDKTYEQYLGKKHFEKIGKKRWNKLLQKAIPQLESLFNYDHLYIGGGNADHIDFALPKNATRIPNLDGLLGGAALWRVGAVAVISRNKATSG